MPFYQSSLPFDSEGKNLPGSHWGILITSVYVETSNLLEASIVLLKISGFSIEINKSSSVPKQKEKNKQSKLVQLKNNYLTIGLVSGVTPTLCRLISGISSIRQTGHFRVSSP